MFARRKKPTLEEKLRKKYEKESIQKPGRERDQYLAKERYQAMSKKERRFYDYALGELQKLVLTYNRDGMEEALVERIAAIGQEVLETEGEDGLRFVFLLLCGRHEKIYTAFGKIFESVGGKKGEE